MLPQTAAVPLLKKLLAPNSPLRRQLRFLSRRFTLAVTSQQRRRFTTASPEGLAELKQVLITRYFPSWYSGVDMSGFGETPEGQAALKNHLSYRLEADRYEFIPWINSVMRLEGASILEIGCGTGSAAVSLAEQGAHVTALDVHAEALEVAAVRCRAHGLTNVDFVEANAQDLAAVFATKKFDLIVFFAVLEHMTLKERDGALGAAWQILPPGKYLGIVETPNRLWFYDGHTAHMPFFHWLPDELAFRYSQLSPRYPFNSRFRSATPEAMLSFQREGRGFSYHELDMALGADTSYRVAGDQTAFLTSRNVAKLAKRVLVGEGRRERLLNAYAPERHRGFFRQHLNLLIQKT